MGLMRWLAILLLLPALMGRAGGAVDPETIHLEMQTDEGTMLLALYPDKAPATVASFMERVRDHYYDGLIFHRVLDGYIIQSGGYRFDLTAKEPGDSVVNESDNGLANERGTLAMARQDDPDSARAQFFINLSDNPNLNASDDEPGYTVFGEVIDGMEVADAIGAVKTRRAGSHRDVPVVPIRILSLRETEAP